MSARYAGFLLGLAPLLSAGQYCSPSFLNGCFNWYALEVQAGSLLWSPGVDACTTSDYTALSASVDAGASLPMRVVNGVWCGCSVWVDFDNSLSFEESENLFHTYVGGQPSYEYDFSIAVPVSTPPGDYRMRIISPWGSDGFTDGSMNGFGPCGSFQYGNFQDFTLTVTGPMSVGAVAQRRWELAPNPTTGTAVITGNGPLGLVTVRDAQGRLVHQESTYADRMELSTAAWAKGPYVVMLANGEARRLMVE